MARSVLYGNVDRSVTLLDGYAPRVLDDVGGIAEAFEALRYAARFRTGVLVTGDKGTGKSLGLAKAIYVFRRNQTIYKANDKTFPDCEIAVMNALHAENRSEMIRAMYCRELGEISPLTARGGDQALLDELTSFWKEGNVGVIVFDEVESLSLKALEVCRDIMSLSVPKPDETISGDGSHFRRMGIGVVLLGTPLVAQRLRRTKEWGERWSRHIEVGRLAHDQLPHVYAAYLPAFAEEAERRGPAAWSALVNDVVGMAQTGSFRIIEAHVHCYLSTYCDNAPEPPRSIEEVTFDEDLFAWSLLEVAGVKPQVEEAAA